MKKKYCKCNEKQFKGLRTIIENGKTTGTVCATCGLSLKPEKETKC